jgi:preprotein translocase subunit SecG
MGRSEIRLRRQMMSTGRIARHRNYSELMRQHDRDIKLKRTLKVFIYFLVILFFIIVLIIVMRWEKRHVAIPVTTNKVQHVIHPSNLVISSNRSCYIPFIS